ncbi:MAG: TldD/PmbA family protein [Oscillospiraceae bacterium]|nr:TldD/PmbA family protein [Oscillospiraceae bacterium]
MKASFSPWLDAITPALRELVGVLGEHCEYVSVLSTDSPGFRLSVSQRSKSVSDSNLTTERGSVVRVCRRGRWGEFAFNCFDLADIPALAARIEAGLDRQAALLDRCGAKNYPTGLPEDAPLELFVEKETGSFPESADLAALTERFAALSGRGVETIPGALDCVLSASSTHISKLFLSKNRYLRQSYVITEGTVRAWSPTADGDMKSIYEGVSGLGGPEILDGLDAKLDGAGQTMAELLASGRIVPGEYEIITDPGVTGLIAHEAFGHGVEMDMFVKGRALGADYIGKRVGSEKVTMHEGALCDESVTAYAFDDEGVLAGDVTEIERGILRSGICDTLSALRLGTAPTGNGKRENYAHKAYTRMTNTVFDSGTDSLEDMIASVDSGYLLRGAESGMEDPKHWGIQCVVQRGYEIAHGRLTGRVVSPVVLTGYVPELLGNISMASPDRGIEGNGACGKGHKEWVKVADGGPWLKTKARLG